MGVKLPAGQNNIYLITLSKPLKGETGKNSSVPKVCNFFQRAVDLIQQGHPQKIITDIYRRSHLIGSVKIGTETF